MRRCSIGVLQIIYERSNGDGSQDFHQVRYGSGSAVNLLIVPLDYNIDIHHSSIFTIGGQTGKNDTIKLDSGCVNFDPLAGPQLFLL